MRVLVKIPHALRSLTGDAAEVEVDLDPKAATIGDAIDAANRMHPGLTIRICNELGQARQHILIYVNDEDIRQLQGLQTALHENDVLFILPAVSGG